MKLTQQLVSVGFPFALKGPLMSARGDEVAFTAFGPFITSWHETWPVQSPSQPANEYPAFGVAVNVTAAPAFCQGPAGEAAPPSSDESVSEY